MIFICIFIFNKGGSKCSPCLVIDIPVLNGHTLT